MIVYLDKLRLRIAHQVACLLAKTKVTPNQITILRFIIAAPVSGYLFSRGDYLHNLLGLAVYVPLVVVDWVDGELARMTNQTSALGKFLDDTLDRILVTIVLASIFYAGMISENGQAWVLLAVLFFPVFFFLTTLLSDFDQMFNLEFSRYAEVRERMHRLGEKPKLIDRVLINFLTVHQNSLTKFCFCISYPLFLGIVINELLLTFSFITLMFSLRALGLCFIIYRVVRRGGTDSALTAVLREYWSKK